VVALHWHRVDSRGHAVDVERAVEVVDLVCPEARRGVLEAGDVGAAVDVGVFDVNAKWPLDGPADIEEAQAAFVLLVSGPLRRPRSGG
jgi:hypothetical protein